MENTDKQFLIYESDSGTIEVQLEQDTVWLSQAQLAELFGTKRPAITKHLGNIFKSNELDKDSVCSILEHAAADGKRYKTQHYNLDVIISVGYRVNSLNATRFRQWATARLNEILIYEVKNNAIEVQLDTSTDNISLHLKNIYQDNELGEESTTKDFLVVRTEGKQRGIGWWGVRPMAEFYLKYGRGWAIITGNKPAKPLNDAQIGGFFYAYCFSAGGFE